VTKLHIPSKTTLLTTIRACIVNGERLLEETYDLEFRKPPSSRFFLIMIAQEEFAKAFILFLVREDIVPFSRPIQRAINDHACKQLVGMIMDYMIMHWDDIEEITAILRNDADLEDRFPLDVGSAIEILRYEKIGRWETNNRIYADGPKYDKSALRIAEGKKDRHKQDALYVRVGGDGSVSSTPNFISEDETANELQRARRYSGYVEAVLDGNASSDRYDKAMAALKMLFSDHSITD
jgi:AbiV family abortive infection protein